MLETLEIEPSRTTKAVVIWLHGLGADGHDFAPLIQQWGLVDELGVRFVLPHAPRRPVTLNNGMVMRAWYDIASLEFGPSEDRAGIEQSQQQLLALIDRETGRGVPADRILLAGFSQGGALALHTALRMAEPLAGVLVLSAYLPLAAQLADEKRADPALLTLRMDHGERDPVVKFALAERSRVILEKQGYPVDFHPYPMEHSLCPQQTGSLKHWLTRQLA
ncbi:MAG TPA: alpha/beta fold hydrolase [Gammaproteobacteria bacterium]|nr:alpha/beta fold hydrolase [Gammaproteobacteria bacterium]